MTWRGPAGAVLAAVLVFVAGFANVFPVAGVLLPVWLGVALAACAWFAYWGVVGSLIGFALPLLFAGRFVTWLGMTQLIILAAVPMGVFVWLLRQWWVDAGDKRLSTLLRLGQAVLIAVVARQLLAFVMFMLPNLIQYPETGGRLLASAFEAFIVIGLTTLVVALLLLRFATPGIKRLQLA